MRLPSSSSWRRTCRASSEAGFHSVTRPMPTRLTCGTYSSPRGQSPSPCPSPTKLVRHLHAHLVSLPHFRRTAECRLGKADSADLAADKSAYGRLRELGGDLCFCLLVRESVRKLQMNLRMNPTMEAAKALNPVAPKRNGALSQHKRWQLDFRYYASFSS
jgi:hypothetical protein